MDERGNTYATDEWPDPRKRYPAPKRRVIFGGDGLALHHSRKINKHAAMIKQTNSQSFPYPPYDSELQAAC